MRIDSSGNVGIGTIAPSGPLHVYKAAESMNVYFQVDSGYGQGENVNLIFKNSSYEMSGITGIDEAPATNGQFRGGLAFKTTLHNGADAMKEQMRIDYQGNVGIGDSSPSYKLDVNGTGRFTGALTCDSDLNATITTAAQPNITSVGTLTSTLNINAGSDLAINCTGSNSIMPKLESSGSGKEVSWRFKTADIEWKVGIDNSNSTGGDNDDFIIKKTNNAVP